MTKLSLLAAVALAAAAPASADPAAPAKKYSFTADGSTYYVKERQLENARLLTGRDSNGKDFSLRVADGWVRGTYNGERMRFRVNEGATTIALAD